MAEQHSGSRGPNSSREPAPSPAARPKDTGAPRPQADPDLSRLETPVNKPHGDPLADEIAPAAPASTSKAAR
jgi:hypothetical protein